MDKYGLGQYAPGMAAYFAGQNHAQTREGEFAKQQELAEIIKAKQIANQQSQQMNPLLIQQQGLTNQGLSAGLPGIAANSALAGTNAQKAAGTLTSDIASTNSKNENNIGKDKSEMANRLVQDLMKFGTVVDQVPVPMRSKVLGEMMSGAGYKMESPMAQQLFKELTSDPDNMSKKMFSISEKIGKAAAQQSPAYHQRMDELGVQGPQKIKEIEATGAEQRKLENQRISAGKYAKKKEIKEVEGIVQSQLNAAKGNPIKTWTILTQAAGHFSQQGDSAKALYYKQQADLAVPAAQAALARVNPNQASPGQFGFETNPPPNLNPQLPGMPGQPRPMPGPQPGQAPPAQPGVGQTSSGVKFKILPN